MFFSLVAFSALLVGALCAGSDLRAFRIPNMYVAGIVLLFVLAFFLDGGANFASLWQHLAASVILFAAGAGLFYLKVAGAGDFKLLAAFGLWTGFIHLPVLLIAMALTGGILGLIALKHKKWGGKVPYGVAIFTGAVFAFVDAGYFSPLHEFLTN